MVHYRFREFITSNGNPGQFVTIFLRKATVNDALLVEDRAYLIEHIERSHEPTLIANRLDNGQGKAYITGQPQSENIVIGQETFSDGVLVRTTQCSNCNVETTYHHDKSGFLGITQCPKCGAVTDIIYRDNTAFESVETSQ